jgi:protein TonB
MVESTARRDRIDSQAVSAWYLWEPPAKPACVYLSFDLIDKLEREVVENFRSLTSRGSEVGGILLGSVSPGSPAGITVEGYEAISCDYSRGPLYRLSDGDLARFERAMEQRSSAGNVQVVGFFRSHTRKGLTLDAEDLAFLDAKFRNPYSLALLVRPFATKASVAGIFLRESSGFNTEVSPLEFPFRSSELTPSKRAPEPPAPAAPSTRAQVVPIATRREISSPPAPTTAPPAAEPPKPPEAKAATPSAPAVPAAPEAKAAAPATPSAPPKGAPVAPKNAPPQGKTAVPAKNVPPPAKAPVPPAATEKAKEAAAPARAETSKAEAVKTEPAKVEPAKPAPKPAAMAAPLESKSASKVPLLTGGLAAALLLFVLLFVYPGFLHKSQHGPATTTQDTSPLTLRVEHTGTDLLLTWNRDSAAIRNATRATLAITDGERHENYDMDLAQLRTGSIVYSPLGGDVSFQMEVIGKDKSRTATETLRLLQTRPSPMPAEGQQSAKDNKNTNNTPTPAAQSNSTPATADAKSPDATPAEESKPTTPPVKAFDASSLGQRLRPARAADLGDVPSPAPGTMGAAPKVNGDGSLPFASMPSAPAAPPPAPARTPAQPAAQPAPAQPPASANAKSNTSSGGQIQAAQLISRKEPEYPLLARQMGAKGSVELIATIGTDGTVKAVKVVKGHPLLVKAAQDAVMQWRYRPTLLNGVPVQNDTKITLNFVAQQ